MEREIDQDRVHRATSNDGKDSPVRLGGGRRLAYTDIGDPDGTCVFMFHGAPSSRLQCTFLDEQFAEYGLRIVSPDRPGYGGSSPQPGRTLADWPADIATLADVLGIDHFGVIGGSSGGPYAAVCCALLPERIVGGIIAAGMIPLDWPGARDGYPQIEVDIMDSPDEESAIAWCKDRFGADGSGFLESDPFEWPRLISEFLRSVSPTADS